MGHLQNSIEKKKYKHLREKSRYKIEGWIEAGVRVEEIAKREGKHRSTIYREIKRGRVERLTSDLERKQEYRANVGQRRYEEEFKLRQRELKIGKDHKFAEYVKKKIKEQRMSPGAIIGQIKQEERYFEGIVSVKTLYNYIDAGILCGVSNKDLWRKRKKKKQEYKRVRVSRGNRLGKKIEERPKEAEDRHVYGHWEGDCVVSGKKGKGGLFVMSERKTRQEKIYKIKRCTQEEVEKVFDELEKEMGEEFKESFKSITFDNGVEFLNWKRIEKSIIDGNKKRTAVYYADPYSSWQRGTNENANGIIRRFIPKGSDISKVSEKQIREIEDWMNNYPRKILGYKTANKVVEEELTSSRK